MNPISTIAAGFLGLTGVILAAMESHWLSEYVDPDQLSGLRWAIHLQLFHAVALLALREPPELPFNLLITGGWILGIILFSGSIYLLIGTGWSWVGPVTPIGGLLLMIGWISLIVYAVQL